MSPITEISPVIETKGLEKDYGRNGARVLRGVELSIAPEERVALIGANGSGKSTLLKCLIGLSPISAGAVATLGERFEGAPSSAQRARLRRQIGFVFQNHCLVRRRCALSNVIHGLLSEPGGWRGFCHTTAKADWRARAMAALEMVDLADKALERVDALSGGQQQRVAIARALVRRPRLLIADEPAASLDPAAGRDVMALFRRLAEIQGATLLFTSHDMAHAVGFADRVIALKDGVIRFDRPSADLSETMLTESFDA